MSGSAFAQLVALGVELVVDALDVVEGRFLGRPVGGADGFRALEGHVLEHVREAGAAFGIVHRAGIHVGVERNDRGLDGARAR